MQNVLYSVMFIISRCEYQEGKGENTISSHSHRLISHTNIFSAQQKKQQKKSQWTLLFQYFWSGLYLLCEVVKR